MDVFIFIIFLHRNSCNKLCTIDLDQTTRSVAFELGLYCVQVGQVSSLKRVKIVFLNLLHCITKMIKNAVPFKAESDLQFLCRKHLWKNYSDLMLPRGAQCIDVIRTQIVTCFTSKPKLKVDLHVYGGTCCMTSNHFVSLSGYGYII